MSSCCVDGCTRSTKAKGMCSKHYDRLYRTGTTDPTGDNFVNPLVCVCEHPIASNSFHFGECQICFRKPLALFAKQEE